MRWILPFVLPFQMGCSLLIELPLRVAAEASRYHRQIPFEFAQKVPEIRIFDKTFLSAREGTVEVRLIRDHPDGLTDRSAMISINDRLVADIYPGEAITVWLPPGPHRVKFRMQAKPDHPYWDPFHQTTKLKVVVRSEEVTTVQVFTTGMGPYLRLGTGSPRKV